MHNGTFKWEDYGYDIHISGNKTASKYCHSGGNRDRAEYQRNHYKRKQAKKAELQQIGNSGTTIISRDKR